MIFFIRSFCEMFWDLFQHPCILYPTLMILPFTSFGLSRRFLSFWR